MDAEQVVADVMDVMDDDEVCESHPSPHMPSPP